MIDEVLIYLIGHVVYCIYKDCVPERYAKWEMLYIYFVQKEEERSDEVMVVCASCVLPGSCMLCIC